MLYDIIDVWVIAILGVGAIFLLRSYHQDNFGLEEYSELTFFVYPLIILGIIVLIISVYFS